MNFAFLILTAGIVFPALIIGYKYFKIDSLYVLGIGCAIGANIFNIGSYPIYVGGLVFGIDSVIYTLFIFSAMIAYINHGKKDAWKLIYSVMCSILLTAILQLVAGWAKNGFIKDITWNFLSYIASIAATYIAILASFKLYEFLTKKGLNVYINLAIATLVASIVNSIIYFGSVSLFLGLSEDFGITLAGSYIGKAMSIVFSVASFAIINKFKPQQKKTDRTDSESTG